MTGLIFSMSPSQPPITLAAWLNRWAPPILIMLIIFGYSSAPGEEMIALGDSINLHVYRAVGRPTLTLTPTPTDIPTATPYPTRTPTLVPSRTPIRPTFTPGPSPTRPPTPTKKPTPFKLQPRYQPPDIPALDPQPWGDYWGWLKLGHIFWYAMLSLAFLRAFRQTHDLRTAMRYALLACAIYASLDEIHQAFTPGRDALLQDVFLDSIVAALALQLRVRLGAAASRLFKK